jgi:hypothetical protein
MRQLDRALILYAKIIDVSAKEPKDHLILLGDPLLESARFYTFPSLASNFDFNVATEKNADQVNYIEDLLIEHDSSYSLMLPLCEKLREVAPTFNAAGFTVFLGSWGMGSAEIGWWIRHLNDRRRFDEYLATTGASESSIDIMTPAFEEELKQQAQNTLWDPTGGNVLL